MQTSHSEAITNPVGAYLDTMFGEARPGNRGYREIGAHAWHAGKTFGATQTAQAQAQAAAWISVKEKLPVGDGVECLCFWNGHLYVDHYYDGSDGGEPAWEGGRAPWYWMPRLADPVVDDAFLAEVASQSKPAPQIA